MYESPITILVGPKEGLEARKAMEKELTDHIKDVVTETLTNEEKIITDYIELSCGKALCLVIDKGELRKALLYDRQQYEKGYADGVRHCEDCVLYNQKKEYDNNADTETVS